MTGIYNDSFIKYLKKNLGHVKIRGNSIVVMCPWCEINKTKKHYHLYIYLDYPTFKCFFAGCEKKGHVSQLIKKIEGTDTLTKEFIDETKIKRNPKSRSVIEDSSIIKIKIPELIESKFKLKSLYIKKRLGFAKDLNSINGLVFDFNEFVKINKLELEESAKKIKYYLHSNFVGFLTENNSILVLRNIDEKQTFKYYKLKIQESILPDYYKIKGGNINTNNVILGEGIFDILTEHIFDKTKLRNETCLYSAVLSSSYNNLIKSIAFHEQLFKMNVCILSDSDIPLESYKKLKFFNSHVINKLIVYYNKGGKDFNVQPLYPEKFIL
jgi:hypothetical protein